MGLFDDYDADIKNKIKTGNDEATARGEVNNALDTTGTHIKIDNARANLDKQTTPTAQAAQAGGVDLSKQSQFAGGQTDLASTLAARAAGQGSSPAQKQLAGSVNDAAQGQEALAASARGVSPYAAQNQADQNIASIRQRGAVEGDILKANETAGAQGALGTILGQQRGQDIGATQLDQQQQQFNAGLRQQAAQGDQQAAAALQQQANALAAQYLQMGMSADQAQAQAQLQIYGTAEGGYVNSGLQSSANSNAWKTALLGGVTQGVGVAIGKGLA